MNANKITRDYLLFIFKKPQCFNLYWRVEQHEKNTSTVMSLIPVLRIDNELNNEQCNGNEWATGSRHRTCACYVGWISEYRNLYVPPLILVGIVIFISLHSEQIILLYECMRIAVKEWLTNCLASMIPQQLYLPPLQFSWLTPQACKRRVGL